MTQSFRLRPAGLAALATLFAVGGFCLLLGIVLWTSRSVHPPIMSLAALSTVATAALFIWFAVAQRHSSVAIEDNQLRIGIPLYGRTIPLDRVVPGSVRNLSLRGDDSYRLTWRTNGLGVPGYQLGWFRDQGAGNGGADKVLAAITGDDVLAFRTKDDYAVILSVTDGAGLERAMRAALPAAT